MMRYKRTRRSTSRNRLQNRSFHLKVTSFIKETTHCIKQFCSLDKSIFHILVHRQIHITHSVTQFSIVKSIVNFSVLIHFWQWQWTQCFTQKGKTANTNTFCTNLCRKQFTFNTNKISQIGQFFEYLIV